MTSGLALIYFLPVLLSVIGVYISHRILRRFFGGICAVISSVSAGIVIASIRQPWAVLVGVFALLQLLNTLRLVEDRMNMHQLRRKFFQTWLVIIVGSASLMLLGWNSFLTFSDYWSAVAYVTSLVFVVSLVLLVTTIIHIRSTRPIRLDQYVSDKELPTLSVLIPARNEDANLADCIHGLLKSDYPKLEIIVLDDCSHDASSDIIKSFAHRGVRFIEGEAPKDKWLAKNQAYQTLADAASGDWLLFSGVDVRFEPRTLRNIVTHALTKEKKMLGLLPIRSHMTWQTAWLAPLRYWYEMAFPRTLLGTPPVLSTCWLIENELFKDVGGFRGVSRSVIPEIYFAKIAKRRGAYQFIRSSLDLVIYTEKSLGEQYATALRTRYPQVRKSLSLTMLAILGLSTLLCGSYVVSLIAFLYSQLTISCVAVIAAVLLSVSQVLITYVTCRKATVISFFAFPLLLAQEIALLFYSMYKYEFSSVEWKGRNICYPIMHITPRLPTIDQ